MRDMGSFLWLYIGARLHDKVNSGGLGHGGVFRIIALLGIPSHLKGDQTFSCGGLNIRT